ncbi:MAG: AAA family ATPase [Bacteroidia bacterium]|nr:AAA family ATPase [Bacteroidia bacterium]MCF8426424.1 AAA family ATPase [Bacteroidia bacterium]MCF8446211.1 AAA family ATPase [Bacteroidia bacterium]
MDILFEQSERLIAGTSLKFKRFLYDTIKWENRLIGIKGARGTGKTTLLLQWLKELDLPTEKAAYFSLDDLYFTKHSLKDTVAQFYKNGGEVLVLDEIHKYPNWSQELKNSYDFFPDLRIVFTGSSIIDISKQKGDLSRRALMYEMPGLSFREYLKIKEIIDIPVCTLTDLLSNGIKLGRELPKSFKPLEHFRVYLNYGYYPFGLDDPLSVHQRINQLVRTIVEVDLLELKDFDSRNAQKLLQLIYILAQQVPFKPNLTSLAEKTGIHRNSLNNYLVYLERAKVISLVFPAGISTAVLQKPEKIFLNNTTLLNALAEQKPEMGSLRETFFLSQISISHKIQIPPKGDFLVDNKYVFEVGGKGKGRKQITGIENAWIVKDDIEFPVNGAIPLWMFGLIY